MGNFPFCPADAASVANIPLADIGMIYWLSPYLLLVHNNRFFILNEVTISGIVYLPFFFTGKMFTWWFIIVVWFIWVYFLFILRDRRRMWQFFSNEVSFFWLRPPTHPLQMKVWKTEYRCIINQTPPSNIGFRTMYSPYACHDKGSIYESLSFQITDTWFHLSVHIIQQTYCTNRMIFID